MWFGSGQNGSRSGRAARAAPWVLTVLLVGHAALLNLWPAGYYGDDLLYIRLAQEHREASVLDFATFEDGAMRRYRPLSKLLQVESYRAVGVDPVLVRLATTATLMLTILALVVLARALGLSRTTACVAGCLFLLHQMPVSVLYRNARMEQYFTLAGLISLLAVECAYRSTLRPVARRAWLAIVFVALLIAYAWSEAALGFSIVVPAWAATRVAMDPGGRTRAEGRRFVLEVTLAALGSVVVFLAWYRAIGAPPQGQHRYAMEFGPRIAANLATAIIAWVTPVSSVEIVRWVRAPYSNWAGLWLSFAAVASVIWLLARATLGLVRSQPSKLVPAVSCLACAFLCLVPPVLTQHMGEPYVYTSVLMFCLAAAIVCVEPRRGGSFHWRRTPVSVLAAVVSVAVLGGHAHASLQKVLISGWNGQRFERMNDNLQRLAGARKSKVINLRDVSNPENYGQLLMPVRLVYSAGVTEGLEVRWSGIDPLVSGPVWLVSDDGSLRLDP